MQNLQENPFSFEIVLCVALPARTLEQKTNIYHTHLSLFKNCFISLVDASVQFPRTVTKDSQVRYAACQRAASRTSLSPCRHIKTNPTIVKGSDGPQTIALLPRIVQRRRQRTGSRPSGSQAATRTAGSRHTQYPASTCATGSSTFGGRGGVEPPPPRDQSVTLRRDQPLMQR